MAAKFGDQLARLVSDGDVVNAAASPQMNLARVRRQRVADFRGREEGDRALPQAGLLFFLYRGKREGIHSIELIYSGAAGNSTLTLQP